MMTPIKAAFSALRSSLGFLALNGLIGTITSRKISIGVSSSQLDVLTGFCHFHVLLRERFAC
jgi:hypothetical protein